MLHAHYFEMYQRHWPPTSTQLCQSFNPPPHQTSNFPANIPLTPEEPPNVGLPNNPQLRHNSSNPLPIPVNSSPNWEVRGEMRVIGSPSPPWLSAPAPRSLQSKGQPWHSWQSSKSVLHCQSFVHLIKDK